MSERRLFVGIAPGEAARRALAEDARALAGPYPGRYAEPALYHLTLAFLGWTDAEKEAGALRAMRIACEGQRAFTLALDGVGVFGGILWRGVTGDAPLRRLVARLREALGACGVPFDARPFVPHITLARDIRGVPCAERAASARADIHVRSIILYESCRRLGRLQYLPRREVFF